MKIATTLSALVFGTISLTAFAAGTQTPAVTKGTTTPANPNAAFQCAVDGVVTTKITQVECQKAGGKWTKGLNPAKPNIDKALTPDAPENDAPEE